MLVNMEVEVSGSASGCWSALRSDATVVGSIVDDIAVLDSYALPAEHVSGDKHDSVGFP